MSRSIIALTSFFPLGRPIRRILHSGAIGTTALAICYPKQAVDITLTNYDRLKAFVKEQITKFNRRRAENPLVKEVQTSVHETVDHGAQFHTSWPPRMRSRLSNSLWTHFGA